MSNSLKKQRELGLGVVLEWRFGVAIAPFGVIKVKVFHSHLNRWAGFLIFHRLTVEGLLLVGDVVGKVSWGIWFLSS